MAREADQLPVVVDYSYRLVCAFIVVDKPILDKLQHTESQKQAVMK